MLKYVSKKVLWAIICILGASFIIFALTEVLYMQNLRWHVPWLF